uniref:(California timema) hypothetical protein n=1 Tax=Timema californicum TaxID=61474 RepID=A0A7R9P3U6_TIMCA|nr:unnamed protein product [Timema californicum]
MQKAKCKCRYQCKNIARKVKTQHFEKFYILARQAQGSSRIDQVKHVQRRLHGKYEDPRQSRRHATVFYTILDAIPQSSAVAHSPAHSQRPRGVSLVPRLFWASRVVYTHAPRASGATSRRGLKAGATDGGRGVCGRSHAPSPSLRRSTQGECDVMRSDCRAICDHMEEVTAAADTNKAGRTLPALHDVNSIISQAGDQLTNFEDFTRN